MRLAEIAPAEDYVTILLALALASMAIMVLNANIKPSLVNLSYIFKINTFHRSQLKQPTAVDS